MNSITTPSIPIKDVVKTVTKAAPTPAPAPPVRVITSPATVKPPVTDRFPPSVTQNATNVINTQPSQVFTPQPKVVPTPVPVIPYTIPKDQLYFNIVGLTKYQNVAFDRYSKNFTENSPQIICCIEYFYNQTSLGCLVIFERYLNASHYEVYKRNIFQADAKFQRVLFLDYKSLEEETEKLIPYVIDKLKLNLKYEDVFIFYDHVIKEDRIYEYKVRAAQIPNNVSEIDFDSILKSNNLANEKILSVSISLKNLAEQTLGASNLSWILAMCNSTVSYFAVAPTTSGNKVLIPSNINSVMEIIKTSFSNFGEKNTLEYILKILGGLPEEFLQSALGSISEINNNFSYDKFRELIRNKIPILNIVLSIVESGNLSSIYSLSKLSVNIPTNKGNETFLTIEGLTNIFNYIRDMFLVLVNSQFSNNEDEIAKLLEDIINGKATTVTLIPQDSVPAQLAASVGLATPVIQGTILTTKPLIFNKGIFPK